MRIQTSLKKILTVNFILTAVVPFLCAGALLIFVVSRSLERDVAERNLLIARGLAGEIERFLQEPLGLLFQVRHMIDAPLLSEGPQISAYLSTVLSSYPYLERLEILDDRGTVRAVAPFDEDHLGNSMAGQRFYTETRGSQEAYWSPAILSFQTGAPTVTLALPAGRTTVVGYLDLSVLGEIAERVRLAGEGFAAVTDQVGTTIAHRDRSLVAQRVNLNNQAFFETARAGREGTFRQPFLGEPHLTSVVRIPLTGWVAVVSQPERTALASAHQVVVIIAGGIALALVLAVVISLVSLGGTLRPLAEVTRQAQRIAEGDYRLVPAAEGYQEVRDLAHAFAAMAAAVRQREQALLGSEQRYRELFEESPIALCEEDFSAARELVSDLRRRGVTDLAAHLAAQPEDLSRTSRRIRIVRANRAALDLYEAAAAEDLVGQLARIVPKGWGPLLADELAQLAAGGRFRVETENRTLTGRPLEVMVEAKVARGCEQTWAKVLVSVSDLTERNRSARERRRLEQQLQRSQKMEALGTLAGGIAHDFNNLLMGIQGRVSLARTELPAAAPAGHLQEIENYIESASGLTRQLLGFARGGKYELRPTDLNTLIVRSSEMFGRTKKEVRIHRHLSPEPWAATVDRSQLEQVMLNLYLNAAQAMPDGGDLTLTTANVTIGAAEAERLTVAAGPYVRITVTDNGRGMDAATRERIFDPFFTTREMGRGTGLGLASSYGIVRSHGGAIRVDSRPGRGSTFDLFLPATGEPAPAAPAPSRSRRPHGHETILLVDDEEMIIEVGRPLLEHLGYRVLTARGGAEAIAVYRQQHDRIDLVILDMIMPDMGGGEVFDLLRTVDPAARVLLSSGYSLDGQAEDILHRGCSGFLQKPFDLDRLAVKLRETLANDGRKGPPEGAMPDGE